MSRRSKPPALDLLRPRRLELGLPVDPPPLRSLARLVLPSGIAGLALVVVVLGLQFSKQTREQSLQGDTGIEPRFAARIKSGLTVIPVIHAKKGGVWEGKPFKVD